MFTRTDNGGVAEVKTQSLGYVGTKVGCSVTSVIERTPKLCTHPYFDLVHVARVLGVCCSI